jgi:pimeloyl-ACP methyl ester carboxylesterase
MKPLVVLVHGAWHWGGCFAKVANLLGAAGYPVVAPDLKSHGYNAASYTEVRSVEDYCAAALEVVRASEKPVVLLGHSLGGVTVTRVAERAPDKVVAAVYLAALMLPAGKTPAEYLLSAEWAGDPAAKELFEVLAPTADGQGFGMKLDEADLIKAAFYADCSDADIAMAHRNLVAVNAAIPLTAETEATAARFGSVRRIYIECLKDKAIPISQQRRLQHDVPGAECYTLDASHSPFFSVPDQLAEILMRVAS